MSADNYLAIRRKPVGKWRRLKWVVMMGDASSGYESKWSKGFSHRDEAIDEAHNILDRELVEYGIKEIESVEEKK